jgi:hypothetical protein
MATADASAYLTFNNVIVHLNIAFMLQLLELLEWLQLRPDRMSNRRVM